jgi:hypothetical protein
MASFAALLYSPSTGWAAPAPDLGTASNFAVLGDTNVTCTAPGSVIGDVGVTSGSFTNTTGCTITGATPPATDAAAVGARIDFLNAYAELAPKLGDCDSAHTLLSTITGPVTLLPGVYCTDAALTGTGVLILDGGGDGDAVWIFKIGTLGTGALTGTNFSVVMTGGGQPCNVFWWVAQGVTMTTSSFQGNILAGDAIDGSITFTDVTLAGRALANVAVTMTRPNVIGCGTLSGAAVCKDKKPKHKHCNQGVGNGHEDCDPGNSNQGDEDRSNDERDGTPGNPGRHGGNGK